MSIAYVSVSTLRCDCELDFRFTNQSPDSKLIASGAIDGIINLFDLQSGRLLHTLSNSHSKKKRVSYGKTGFPSIFRNGEIDGHIRVLRSKIPCRHPYCKCGEETGCIRRTVLLSNENTV